jgi:hypothetical protein
LQEGDGEPNDDLAELIGDIHWAADRIEQLEAAMDKSYDPGCDCACCDIVREEGPGFTRKRAALENKDEN